jgi:hypothetical protein
MPVSRRRKEQLVQITFLPVIKNVNKLYHKNAVYIIIIKNVDFLNSFILWKVFGRSVCVFVFFGLLDSPDSDRLLLLVQ